MYTTACWIAKNEEKNIGKSIDSVSGAVDEMIVVDTGSTDKTVEIAEQKGAKVLHFEWISDFAAAKNFALDNAKYGVVFFLDADEYFEEPLTKKEINAVAYTFNKNKELDVLSVPRDDIETEDGSVKNKGFSNRVLRHDGKVRYNGKIHEEMTKNGLMPVVGMFDKKLIHTGYTKEVLADKARRNAQMLEEVADGTVDTYESFNQQMYMVRENEVLNPEKAFESWKKVAPQTRHWEYGIMRYRDDFITHLLRAILVALDNRDKVSRKFVKKYLIDLFKKQYKDYKMGPLMDLLYIQFYDKRDDLLLDEFDKAMGEAEKKTWKGLYEREGEMLRILYAAAAQAASKRAEIKRAAEYASKAIDVKNFDAVQSALIAMIIDYAAGMEPARAVETLNKMYPQTKTENKHFLTRQLLREDTKDLYIYYLKQMVESGIANLDEQLIYALLSGGVNGALQASQRALAYGDEKAFASVGALLFIMTIAFNTDQLYRSNPQGLAAYARIIESYFSGVPIDDVTDDELIALSTYYPYIAFLGGKDPSDKFLRIFKNEPKQSFAAYEEYNRRSRNYQGIYDFDTTDIDEKDWFTNSRKVNAAIQTTNFDYAYEKLKDILEYRITDEILDLLLLTADESSGDIQKKAYDLYNRYIDYFEKMIDRNDIVNTGIIVEKKDMREKKAIASMSAREFKEMIANAPPKTDMLGYYDVLENVLKEYKKQNYFREYLEGLTELIGAGVNKAENKEKLKSFLEELGNDEVAEVINAI